MFYGLLLGILSSFFFSFTFILNRSMSIGGGNYLWGAALRYVVMVPILYIYLKIAKKDQETHQVIKKDLSSWLLWSIIGFGIFYLAVCFGSNYGASWLVAGLWQFTIVAGVLLTPLFGKKIPKLNLSFSFFILLGVFLLQIENAKTLSIKESVLSILSIGIAAFAYPLGNRKMMELSSHRINTAQRVYGMALCSMPMWIVVMIYAYFESGFPSISQLVQASLVGLFSGVIATLMFFKGTEIVRNNPAHLAIVESTIAGEIPFTLLGGVLFLDESFPTSLGWIGLIIVIAGMILNSLSGVITNKK